MTDRRELIIVVNVDFFFLSHRRDIAIEAMSQGWDVTVVTRDTGHRGEIESDGIRFVNLPVNPTGMNPFAELRTLFFLTRYYMRHRNAIVHHVGLKSILWGGLAATIVGVRGVVNAVSGLGTLFGGRKSSLLRRMLFMLLDAGHRRGNMCLIFQNHDDEAEFLDAMRGYRGEVRFIKGSGVNLQSIRPSAPAMHDVQTVIFTGRIIREKGVMDLIEAAELLRPQWKGRVRFLLCGGLYGSPKSISDDEMKRRCDGDYIRWTGYTADVPRLLAGADIMAFPSYYREGVPKSLLEASAAGLPIVTTDSVGCRDTVIEGLNGFKVPPHNPRLIADRLELLLKNPSLRANMGRESRIMAERDYDLRDVVAHHLDIYEQLYSATAPGGAEMPIPEYL